MKKTISILLAAVMLLGMSACSENKEDAPQSSATTTGEKAPSETTNTTTGSQLTAEDLKEWGVPDDFTAWNENGFTGIYFRFPFNTGVIHGQGLLAAQQDGTIVVVGADNVLQPIEVSSVDTVLPAYFVATASSLSDYLN